MKKDQGALSTHGSLSSYCSFIMPQCNNFRAFLTLVSGMAMLSILVLWSPVSCSQQAGGDDEALFKKTIAPIFEQRCLECHNSKRARGGLDLSTREKLLHGGDSGPVIVPGQPEKSHLLKLIQPPKARMPQRGDALTAEQVAAISKWIAGGADWPKEVMLAPKPATTVAGNDWWSVKPLKRPMVPAVKKRAWIRTPIDAFILAELEKRGLTPATEANRLTFLRRAKFDLHGLPPTPEEIDEFLNDLSPDAYARLIDRLLASPFYGERWGRHWLDIVHYADTHGYDKDKRRLWAWLFRDWVISAINRDMPYDRFVLKQLAGDVLEPDSAEGIIATGFVVAGPWDFVGHVELREGTVEKKKTRSLDRDDMVANAMSTFISVTAHCARCHDHKFDPISQKEYYQLQAVFAGVERGDRTIITPQVQQQLAQLEVQRKQQLARQADLQRQLAQMTSPRLRELQAEQAKIMEELKRYPRPVKAEASRTNGYHSQIAATQDTVKWVQVDLGTSVPIDEIRLLPARPTDYPDTPGFGFPIRFQVAASDDPEMRNPTLLVDSTASDFPNPGDRALIIRPEGQRARFIRITANRLWERQKDFVLAFAELQVFSGGKNVARGASVMALDSIEAGRWSKRYLVDHCDSRHMLADGNDHNASAAGQRWADLLYRLQQIDTERHQLAAERIYPRLQQQFAEAHTALTALEKRIKEVQEQSKVYAVLPQPPRPIHLLHRGNVEHPKELVQPAALSLVPGLDPTAGFTNQENEGQRRLALARWIVDKRNVLTWRSIVNRVWQYHFGRGLVETPNDFGKNGAQPSHPALLDWLALEFRDNGMSLKKLHKLIMLSAVYRQSSEHNEANARIDADNRYLWRMNRWRLDAESIRDSVLAVSGQLDTTMGGPGFDLFRFKDDHSPIYDHSDISKINDPKTFRRTVYRFIVRSVPNPFLECLDCADPNISVPKRNTTLTALQALALLNNPFMIKQSEYFAQRLEKATTDPRRQMELAYLYALGRMPAEEELRLLLAHRREHGLANLCRVLFNTNEFMFVD